MALEKVFEYGKSIAELRKQLKELKNDMLKAEEGSKEYTEALRRAAEVTHILSEQTLEIKRSLMDFGQIADNATKTVGGLVAGFQAAQAAMNLMGVENETVIKSLQKMLSLMAFTQALPALKKGIDGFKGLATAISTATGATSKFGKVLISTGLGALVVVLGLVIANFDEISKWLDEITGQTDFLGTVMDAVMGGLLAAGVAVIKTVKAVGNAIVTYVTTPFKAVWNAIQAYTSTNGGFADKLKAAGAAMKNGFVSDWKSVGDDFKEIGTASAEAYQKGFEKNRAKRMAKNEAEAAKEGKKEGKAKGEAKADAEEEAYYKKRMKQLSKEERTEMLALQKRGLNYEEYVKEKDALEEKFTKKRIDELKNILETETDLTEQEIANLEDQLISLQDKLLKAPEKEETKTKTEDEESPEEKKLRIIKEGMTELATMLDEVSENPAWGDMITTLLTIGDIFIDLKKQQEEFGADSIEYSRAATNAYLLIAAVGFSAMSQMFLGIAAEQDTSNKKGFETAKKMQIASATMTTLSSVLQALAAGNSMASQMGLAAPVGWALGAAMATMVGALGAVNIAKIAKQKFGGSSSSVSGAVASPNTSAVAAMNAPVQYTQDVQGASIEGAISDTKVYVTEGDITDTQKKVDVAESENRY